MGVAPTLQGPAGAAAGRIFCAALDLHGVLASSNREVAWALDSGLRPLCHIFASLASSLVPPPLPSGIRDPGARKEECGVGR